MGRIALPKDGNGVVAQLVPATAALAITYDATISASTEITLNTATTFVEVTAIDKAILLLWGISDASTSAFDEVIPANTSKGFFVPNDASGVRYTALNIIEQAATAIAVVIEK